MNLFDIRLTITRVFLVLAAAVAALVLAVAPAQATTGHVSTSTFGVQGGNDPGGFAFGISPYGVAVNASDGHVFATDPSHTDSNGLPVPRVEEFDASGAFQAEFPIDATLYNTPLAIAVDPNGSGAVYVSAYTATSQGVVLKYSPTGAFQYALVPDADTTFNPTAVTVDPSSGDVYVAATDATSGTAVVEVFGDTGTFQSSFDGSSGNDSALAAIGSIAVDGAGNVYVTDVGKSRVDRFSTAGAFQATVVNGNARAVAPGALAVDSSTDELYIVENSSQVEVFAAGGTDHEDTFSSGGFGVTGVSVNSASGTVYLTDSAQALGLIATPFAGPTVVSTPASSVTSTTATVNGTVNPEGIAADHHFEYGTDANYGNSTAGGSVGSGTTADPVSDQLTDLTPNTTYHYRVVGSNANGAVHGADRTFTTDPRRRTSTARRHLPR